MAERRLERTVRFARESEMDHTFACKHLQLKPVLVFTKLQLLLYAFRYQTTRKHRKGVGGHEYGAAMTLYTKHVSVQQQQQQQQSSVHNHTVKTAACIQQFNHQVRASFNSLKALWWDHGLNYTTFEFNFILKKLSRAHKNSCSIRIIVSTLVAHYLPAALQSYKRLNKSITQKSSYKGRRPRNKTRLMSVIGVDSDGRKQKSRSTNRTKPVGLCRMLMSLD
ncbi:uncharacterized protein V6R79_016295 [Siganus canaliculatus]